MLKVPEYNQNVVKGTVGMERFGFIHEKLDIKILILYILRRLPAEVDAETLAQLTLFDDGISYFDYSDCLAELSKTEHLEQGETGIRITEKGERNGSTIENSLPYSVRKKADSLIAPVAAKLRRNSMIGTSHKIDEQGGVKVALSLEDGMGEIINMSLLVPDEELAIKIEKNFRGKAEKIYNAIVDILSE